MNSLRPKESVLGFRFARLILDLSWYGWYNTYIISGSIDDSTLLLLAVGVVGGIYEQLRVDHLAE